MRWRQSVPRDEQEGFAFWAGAGGQGAQLVVSLEDGRSGVEMVNDVPLLANRGHPELIGATSGAALVGDCVPGHDEQPRQRGPRDFVASPPCNEEDLRDHVVCLVGADMAGRVGVHTRCMLTEQVFEILHTS